MSHESEVASIGLKLAPLAKEKIQACLAKGEPRYVERFAPRFGGSGIAYCARCNYSKRAHEVLAAGLAKKP